MATNPQHRTWVKICHWIVTLAFIGLLFTGIEILMVHPRLYWGEVGNDLTPALFELPISRNYKHGGFTEGQPFFQTPGSPVSAGRTYDIFNQNGWGRSLHFLAGWFLVVSGLIYLLLGIFGGHFRKNIFLSKKEFKWSSIMNDLKDHLRLLIPRASGGPDYGILQKISYTIVIFIALPLMVITGFTMAPAITAAFPFLLDLFGGYQSARTIHFFSTIALLLFFIIHIVMVILSGFKKQILAMTFKRPYEKETDRNPS
ncbi:MAG TPA: cytochrome b/b6 domain-containing protein [Chitinophagaceae bacterium]|nr:cytochrome b/b6 domain-containing protein [Chitinophagaceae bacterium]